MTLPPSGSYDPSRIPALEPPPGVIPNFIDPYTRGPMLLALSAVAIGIMYLFVIARFYYKIYIQRKPSWDDRKLVGRSFCSSGTAHMLIRSTVTCTLATVGPTPPFQLVSVKAGNNNPASSSLE